jgi:hypothetical protein
MLVEHEGRAPQGDPGAWVGAGAEVRINGVVRLFGRHRDDRVIG